MLALSQSHNNKSPGADGLPFEVYKLYVGTLLPILLKVYNEAFQTGALLTSMNEAIMVVLLKPGKYVTLPDSYRPISLLTTNVKLLILITEPIFC